MNEATLFFCISSFTSPFYLRLADLGKASASLVECTRRLSESLEASHEKGNTVISPFSTRRRSRSGVGSSEVLTRGLRTFLEG